MISGAHAIIYSTNADADRAFFRDVLSIPAVDAGDGWLIFALRASELAFHPAETNGTHELYLLCDDVDGFAAAMEGSRTPCSAIEEQPWGRLVHITLPSGARLGVYQAKHARPTT